jgi:hypothetical protein
MAQAKRKGKSHPSSRHKQENAAKRISDGFFRCSDTQQRKEASHAANYRRAEEGATP